MSPLPDTIDISFGVDANYAPHAAAVIASILANTRHRSFRFIILHTDVTPELQARIERAAPSADFVWRLVGDDDLPEFATRGHFTRAILFRLGLEKMAPADCRRLIYLDSDLTVAGDVVDLWNADLQGCSIGAVADEQVAPDDFAARWDLAPGGRYFNTGVLLVDLDRVRDESGFSQAAALVGRHYRELQWPDQDALNIVYWGRWRALEPTWNVQRGAAIDIAFGRRASAGAVSPKIIHYTGADKPWNRDAYHPWSWLYWKALGRTGLLSEMAARQGMGVLDRLRLKLRWLQRRPSARLAAKAPVVSPRDYPLDASLVVATRNRADQLRRCLEAMGTVRFDGAWEVIVVDNGSTDGTSAVIDGAAAAMPAPLVKIFEPRPGVGAARNSGIAAARGRIVAFTDDDCYVAPDFLTEAVRAFEDQTIGYVTGRVELFDPSDAPVTVNSSLDPRRYPAHGYLHSDGIIGANLAFRRSVLDEISGFDELMGAGMRFAGEDVDAAARAGSLGWTGAYRPTMVVSHHHGRKAADVPKLYKFYDIGRGAYTVKYLLRGELLAFLKGVASIRWRMGPLATWRPQTFSTPMWEIYGAVGYSLAAAARRLAQGPAGTHRSPIVIAPRGNAEGAPSAPQ